MIILDRDQSIGASPTQQIDSLKVSVQRALGALESDIEEVSVSLADHTHKVFKNSVEFTENVDVKGNITIKGEAIIEVTDEFKEHWDSIMVTT